MHSTAMDCVHDQQFTYFHMVLGSEGIAHHLPKHADGRSQSMPQGSKAVKACPRAA